MRVIFIPGYGEYPFIFDKIHPSIPGEKIFLDNWTLLGNQPRPGLNVLEYAGDLIQRFNIGKDDLLIGHSMGGWIALHIKHLVGCPIIQISSWTDRRKVAAAVWNRGLVYWMVKRGFVYNAISRKVVVWKFGDRPSRELFRSILEGLSKGNKNNVVNQLRLIFNPLREKAGVSPDLRIHARADKIIHFPDGPTYEVPGDHLALWTFPEEVSRPILEFLQEQQSFKQ